MRRPFRHLAFAAVLGALVAASPAGAESGLTLTQVGGARFPERAYVLTLPQGMYLDAERVELRENGDPASGLSVVSADAADAGQFGVVLVVDASNSMRGVAIENAVAAGRAFAEHRNESQKVAIVSFNRTTRVLLPFTTSAEAIDAALAEPPPLGGGTHIYDGAATALDLLAEAKIAAGSIVVLSDGSDTGSAATAADVVARATAAHVRVFSVGLRSKSFRPQPLEELAAGGGGHYSEAAAAQDLQAIFDALGAQLANEYLLRYRSAAGPRSEVHVAVRVRGVAGIASVQYTTPELSAEPAGPFYRSFAERFWRSPAGMVTAALGAAVLFAIGLLALLRPRARTVRRRLGEFVTLAATAAEDERRRQRELVLARAERSFERTRWWARFKEDLALADIQTPPVYIVVGTAAATMLAMWILYLLAGLLVAPLGLVIPFVVRGLIRRRLGRKREAFADQLPDNLQVLSSALRAGHSLVGALSVVVEDCAEPSQSEFGRVIADEQLGVSLEEAFNVIALRMASRDLEQVALVAALQQETGGNTAEVLDRVADTIRTRSELRRLVKTLTAQGRASRWVVSLLPVGLLLLITLINPAYMQPLYTHPVGRVLLVIAAVMVVSGSLVIKRIVNIKV